MTLLKKNLFKTSTVDLVNLNQSTPDQDWGDGEIFYLDRHDVDCKEGALQGFHLKRPNEKAIAYSFACSNSKAIKKNQIKKETPLNDTNESKANVSINYLDRHEVKCDNKYALQRFTLKRTGTKVQYIYTCVEVNCLDIKNENTPESDAGSFSSIFLDRQNVRISPDRVLIGFKLNTRYQKSLFSSKAFFSYTLTSCKLVEDAPPAAPPLAPSSPEPNTPTSPTDLADLGMKTKEDDNGQGSIFFLDRHDVDCKQENAIQGFVLKQPSPSQISYSFACKKSAAILTDGAYDNKTKEDETDGNEHKSVNYLDRHNVSCNPSFALQRFKMERNGNKIFYSYKCVKVRCTDPKTTDTTETDAGDKATSALTQQSIQLENGRVLTGFKLNSRYDAAKTYFKYTISSCKLDEKAQPPAENPSQPGKPVPETPSGPPVIQPVNPTPPVTPVTPEDLTPVPTAHICYEKSPNFGKEKPCKEEKDECRPENPEKSNIKKCLPKLGKVPEAVQPQLLKENEVCYRSTPDFNGKEKKCEQNLQCRFNDPSANNPPGSVKYCLNVFVAPPERKLALGETCFAHTPEFKDKQKPCVVGLVCRFENPKLSNQPKDAVMKCMEVDKPLPPPFVDAKKKGKLFCLTNCVIDKTAREKNCYEKKIEKCKRCTINPTLNDKEKKDICEAVCNSRTNENVCDFYGYMNNKKKDYPVAVLSKYGIEITKR